jgi:predicted metal-dependent phosphoesterase TrpH
MTAILHCHSLYSPDSNLSLQSIINVCTAHQISVIALTDHNEIQGALELQKIAPEGMQVIIGEEISSIEGHIIGLFLERKIAPGLSIEETILQIRSQGGVVLLPHPFDRIRKGSIGLEVTQRIKDKIDFIEIFNARCLLKSDNVKAERFAKEHNLWPYVGSDSHFGNEYINAVCTMDNFNSKEEFVEYLKLATFSTRPAGWVAHLRSQQVKRINKRLETI